jgi:hypothetical protein
MSASICGNDRGEGVPVIGIAGQDGDVGDELAAGGVLHRGGNAHLDAELSGSRGGRWSNVPARWNSACGPTRTCRQGRRLGVKTAGGAPAARLGNARS